MQDTDENAEQLFHIEDNLQQDFWLQAPLTSYSLDLPSFLATGSGQLIIWDKKNMSMSIQNNN